MAAAGRPHLFFLLFLHRQHGPLYSWLTVLPKPGHQWQTRWDIGTIDRDPRLSDVWFCRDECESQFRQLLEAAANKSDHFELPGATSRWGEASGMPHKTAVELAEQIVALWQGILQDWENTVSMGEGI